MTDFTSVLMCILYVLWGCLKITPSYVCQTYFVLKIKFKSNAKLSNTVMNVQVAKESTKNYREQHVTRLISVLGCSDIQLCV